MLFLVLYIIFIFLSLAINIVVSAILPRLNAKYPTFGKYSLIVLYLVNNYIASYFFDSSLIGLIFFNILHSVGGSVLGYFCRFCGITGTVGSGKSTVCQLIGKRPDCTIINIDDINRRVLEMNRDSLVKIFGSEVIKDGEIDRAFIRQEIFTDEKKKKRLTDLTHKYVFIHLAFRIFQEKFFFQMKHVFLENAIMLKIPILCLFAYPIVVVHNPNKKLQIERFTKRDKADAKAFEAIYKNNLSDDEMKAKADYVITNAGSLIDLEKEVDRFLEQTI